MNRLAELERILANSVVMTGESKQFDSELRSYSFLLSNMFLTGSRGKNPGSQETVVLQIWQKKNAKRLLYMTFLCPKLLFHCSTVLMVFSVKKDC